MIQLQVLNKLLDSKDSSFLTLNNITSDYFSDYKDEFNFIKDHIDKYGKIPDKETFVSKFPNFDIIQVNEDNNYLIDELYNDKNMRMLAVTFNKVRDLLNCGKVNDAMTLYMNSSQDLSKAKHLDCIDIINDTSRYSTYVERSRDISKAYVKTGFPELDLVIGGWDRSEEYATIVARAGVGKTWWLLKSAISAAEAGLTVGIYSGEMSVTKVGYRIDTLFGHISNSQIIRGKTEIQNTYKEYIDSLKNKISGSIKVLTPNMIGGPATVSALKAFIEKENLDMLCIDQHSLLEDDRHAKTPIEKAANISRDIKNLQVIERIPIITVSQQNRESTEQGLSTKFIAQSDRIGQDSTTVIFLEQKDNILTMTLAKSRDSESYKKLQYAIDLDKGIFTYIPTESDALNGRVNQTIENQSYSSDSISGEEIF